ncbi:MAG TPA: MarR family winged helix-turn-helix transcriptional regulator [Polyangiaceae bacterium]|nr:MarR family winged helix-turn-helix transcriptional regulator [Polyangiaceae bacterium]
MKRLALKDYRALAAFRYEIRRFLAFSERAARAAGIEPQQHQALLAIHGLPEGMRPTIGTLAERLCVEHHTAVAIVDKVVEKQLAVRERSQHDKREVLVRLTPAGSQLLRGLSAAHREQLGTVGLTMVGALSTVLEGEGVAAPLAGAPLEEPSGKVQSGPKEQARVKAQPNLKVSGPKEQPGKKSGARAKVMESAELSRPSRARTRRAASSGE